MAAYRASMTEEEAEEASQKNKDAKK